MTPNVTWMLIINSIRVGFEEVYNCSVITQGFDGISHGNWFSQIFEIRLNTFFTQDLLGDVGREVMWYCTRLQRDGLFSYPFMVSNTIKGNIISFSPVAVVQWMDAAIPSSSLSKSLSSFHSPDDKLYRREWVKSIDIPIDHWCQFRFRCETA
jgi:hypothetical protein